MIDRSTSLLVAATLFVGAFGIATAGFAQTPETPSKPSQGGEMTKGHDGMMGGMTGGTTGNKDSEYMKQMTKMMENCNRMMERADASSGTQEKQ